VQRLTSFPPPLLREWPVPVRVVFAGLLPAAFGFLCGAPPAASASSGIRKFRREPAGVSPPLAVSSARR
jgi:hypothetical protein